MFWNAKKCFKKGQKKYLSLEGMVIIQYYFIRITSETPEFNIYSFLSKVKTGFVLGVFVFPMSHLVLFTVLDHDIEVFHSTKGNHEKMARLKDLRWRWGWNTKIYVIFSGHILGKPQKKKYLLLMAGPLRPNPLPPPIELNVRWNFETLEKKFPSYFFLKGPALYPPPS